MIPSARFLCCTAAMTLAALSPLPSTVAFAPRGAGSAAATSRATRGAASRWHGASMAHLSSSSSSWRRRPTVSLRAQSQQSAEELELEAKKFASAAEALRLEIEAAERDAGIADDAADGEAEDLGGAGAEEARAEAEAAVLAANAKFYTAYQGKGLSKMRKCWWEDDYTGRSDSAVVVHLGKPVIMGIENVMHSFKGIFRGKSVTDVTVEEATVVSVSKTVAVVSAKVLIVGSGGKSQTRTVATNVFEMHPRYKEWLVISHHSSPILFPDIPKQQVKNE